MASQFVNEDSLHGKYGTLKIVVSIHSPMQGNRLIQRKNKNQTFYYTVYPHLAKMNAKA